VISALANACAPASAPPPNIETKPIEIVAPARPISIAALVRAGSFSASHVSPEGMVSEFADVLRSAKVFAVVLDSAPAAGAPAPRPPSSPPVWELELAGSDYGEPNGYSLELQVAILRQRNLLQTYFSKQSIRAVGTRSQLTIGPPELGQLAERAIRDLVRQLAADSERLAGL
jgi:hypothetical protein